MQGYQRRGVSCATDSEEVLPMAMCMWQQPCGCYAHARLPGLGSKRHAAPYVVPAVDAVEGEARVAPWQPRASWMFQIPTRGVKAATRLMASSTQR